MRNSIHTDKDGKPQMYSRPPLSKIRTARIIFVVVIVAAGLAVMWPGYTFFSSATPLIFGFPPSFAWMILWVIISFIAMLSLYFSDKKAEEED